uniref:PrimPol/ATP-dependent RNA helicase n=1 Tax=Clandestinovirus TaxID=2831644 RepID=A0A8F8PMB8_9VIRU|nr:primPol/ATP-dependent RNA helicase [Clandestinovirus]
MSEQRPQKRQKVDHSSIEDDTPTPDFFKLRPYGIDKQTAISWWESRTEDDGKVPWARDIIVNGQWQMGKKAYFVDTHIGVYQMIQSLPPPFRSFYELVGNQFGWARLFIDLDIKSAQLDGNDPKDHSHVDALVRLVIETIVININADFNLNVKPADFFLTCAGYKHDNDPSKCKNSIHITCPEVVFEYNQELGKWLMDKVAPSLPKDTLDTSVYGQGVLRIPYTTKGGESRPLMPYVVTFPDGSSTANVNDYGEASYWVRCLMKTFECPGDSSPLRYATSGTRPIRNDEGKHDETLSLCTFTFGNAINMQLSTEAKETIIEGLQVLLPTINWSSTTFKCFASDKSQRMILCIRPVNKTTCLVTGVQHKESQSYIVLSREGYMCKCYNPDHSGTVKKYPTHSAIKELVRLINHFHNDHCLRTLLENVQPKKPLYLPTNNNHDEQSLVLLEENPSLQHIPYEPLSIHKRLTYYVDANMKLGKSGECRLQLSELLIKKPTTRFIFLVHRRALAHHTFAKVNDLVVKPLLDKGLPLLPFENYLDTPSDRPLNYSCVVSIESQRRLNLDIDVDLLILDEVESILPQTTADTNRKNEAREAQNNTIFNRLITDTPHVWCFDAELSEETKWYFEQTRPNSFIVYHQNMFQNWSDIKVVLYPNNYAMLYAFAQKMANDDRRVYGCFAQKRFMNETAKPLIEWLSQSRGFKAQFYDSDTDEIIKKDHLSDVDHKWTEYDVICTTSTIQAGTSFEKEHFDHVFGFFGGLHGLIVQDMLQMLGRVRNVGCKEVHLALNLPLIADPTSQKPFITDYELVERGLLSGKGYRSRSEYPNVTPSYFVNIHSIVKSNKSKNRSVAMVIERFKQMGCSIELAPWVPQRGDIESFVAEMRSISSEAKDCRMNMLISSPELDADQSEELMIKLKTGVGLTMEQKCSLFKYSLRKFYDYHDDLDPEWVATYSRPKTKRLFVINRFLLHGTMKGQTSNQFVQAFKDHEHHVQKRYEMLLAGGELGKHFQSLQLEFVAKVCIKLGIMFPDVSTIPNIELTYKEFDKMTDEWLIPSIRQFSEDNQRPFFPSSMTAGPIFYPKNCKMETIDNAMQGKSNKIRTFLWNIVLSFIGLEFAPKNRKAQKVILSRTVQFSYDTTKNTQPKVTPMEMMTHQKCLLDDIE